MQQNTIDLGDEKFISLTDISGLYDKAMPVDELIAELEPLWSLLETHCVAGCCGLDAFDFSAENLAQARRKLNGADAAKQLQALQIALTKRPSLAVMSKRMNQYLDRPAFDRLIEHLIQHFPPSL